jgi:hypothetical protein
MDHFGHHGLRMVGLTTDQRLICFPEFRPGNAVTIGTISGLSGGDTMLVGIDFRPADGMLYGVGNAGGVYVIDTMDASAKLVNRLSVALSGQSFGVDFNPTNNLLRIVSDSRQNLSHDVENTSGTGTTVNANLNRDGIVGAAYTNNDDSPNTFTTLYNIDANLDEVTIQSPPTSGVNAPTGKLTVDTTSAVGFDIYTRVRNEVALDNQGFASLTTPDGVSRLVAIRLTTGRAEPRGSFASGTTVIDIAIPLEQL